MAESVIVVQRNGGGYVKGVKVSLGFFDGVTKGAYTDSNGEAVVQHSNTAKPLFTLTAATRGQ